MFYNARWYDVQLGRFAQADTIVPGEKHSNAQTIQDVANTMYTALTVNYSDLSINAKHNADNAFIQKHGGSLINVSQSEKKKAKIRDVPLDSQFFDRYAYGLNNPLTYKDPTGHIAGEEGGNKDINYRSYYDSKGRVVYRLEYFGEVMFVYETEDTKLFLSEFKQHARDYASSVEARSSSGKIVIGGLAGVFFGGMMAGASGGTLGLIGLGVALAGVIVAVGSWEQYNQAGVLMESSKKDAKKYFDALKPFSGLESPPPLPPLPNQ